MRHPGQPTRRHHPETANFCARSKDQRVVFGMVVAVLSRAPSAEGRLVGFGARATKTIRDFRVHRSRPVRSRRQTISCVLCSATPAMAPHGSWESVSLDFGCFANQLSTECGRVPIDVVAPRDISTSRSNRVPGTAEKIGGKDAFVSSSSEHPCSSWIMHERPAIRAGKSVLAIDAIIDELACRIAHKSRLRRVNSQAVS